MNLTLVWDGDLKFSSGPGGAPIRLDSSSADVLSPVQTLCYALMGCMGMDVAHVLRKGQHDLQSLSLALEATRAPEPPRRLLSVAVHFEIAGPVPDEAVARAIDLSREKYCSVWHSLRQDIQLTTTFTVRNP